jgi:hypothetical protein
MRLHTGVVFQKIPLYRSKSNDCFVVVIGDTSHEVDFIPFRTGKEQRNDSLKLH